jgi:hypothetical protein
MVFATPNFVTYLTENLKKVSNLNGPKLGA